ncbi:GTP-binding protein [Bengtsoniella intestinalis]|uniref:GTP-binding protein n=1 Tax=Bengtsoniella intestinalis TaxID=3073143 RepID=UPI00391EE582
MIQLILATGFLGAGKTTLVKQIIDTYKTYKIGVIVNEFGEINVDGALLTQEGVQMAELSNGSIFCACIKDKFVDSLIQMTLRDLDYVFIEASGLADPSSMQQILNGIAHKVLNPYDYKGSICVVDGQSFLDLIEVLPAITSQLEFSGAVIVNKADLVDEEQLQAVFERVEEINDHATIYVTNHCSVDIEQVVSQLHVPTLDSRPTTNTFANRPACFVAKGTEIMSYEALELFLAELLPHTYRMKGFVKTDRGDMEISTVGNNLQLLPWSEPLEQNQLVVISAVGIKMMSLLTKAIATHAQGKLKL